MRWPRRKSASTAGGCKNSKQTGEFGRTPMNQGSTAGGNYDRDHHMKAFTIWMAGGGIKPGITIGATDELGYNPVEEPVHINDFQATNLYCMGIDHEKLTTAFRAETSVLPTWAAT